MDGQGNEIFTYAMEKVYKTFVLFGNPMREILLVLIQLKESTFTAFTHI